ncbi:MAG: signal peptidase I [Candidatus Calescibacterium sp.]|nr:signal peptidase I [Candidatus Calescibacterium sp.]MCX7972104.1 signal peptidase I [bacterium]MDW8194792.1 signal peptidase I [Candidatus Calescibacterium sp.]
MSETTLFFLIVILFLIRLAIVNNVFSFPKFWLPTFLRKVNKKSVLDWIDSALTAGIFALVFIILIGRLYIIPSSSMEPTLKPGDIVLGINMLWFQTKGELKINRGDIIIFKPPIDNKLYIKRLIGLPNEKLMIIHGNLYINDKLIKEDYISNKDYYDYGPVKVPPQSYFFLGDNRPNSYDSHLWPEPFVNKKDIKAKAVAIIFPPNRIKILSNPFNQNEK